MCVCVLWTTVNAECLYWHQLIRVTLNKQPLNRLLLLLFYSLYKFLFHTFSLTLPPADLIHTANSTKACITAAHTGHTRNHIAYSKVVESPISKKCRGHARVWTEVFMRRAAGRVAWQTGSQRGRGREHAAASVGRSA